MRSAKQVLILFDGVCKLCSASVVFVIRRDRRRRFRFASLQSPLGQRLLAEHGYDRTPLESVLLIVDGRCYRKSRAILEILRRLDAPWPMLYALILLPRKIADYFYDFVATHRYGWFGKRGSCWVPAKEWRDRIQE